MAFGFAGASAGASDALQQMLEQKRAAFLQQQQIAMQQEAQARQAEQFAALERERAADRTHRDREFTAAEAERTRRAGRESMADSHANQAAGVRRMIGDFLVQRGGQPLDNQARQTLQGMALQEGVELPEGVTQNTDADVERARRIAEAQYGAAAKFRAPERGPQQSPEWVKTADGKVVKRIPQPGDSPYDPVAARSAQPANPTEAADTAREVQRLSGALAGSKGFGGVFGKWSAATPNMLASQDTVDARTLLNSLKGLLTIENMGKMKGVLSDADMRILQQASTTLAAEMSEPAALAELNRLGRVMSKLTGEAWTDIGGVPQNTGAGSGRASGARPAGGGFKILSVED